MQLLLTLLLALCSCVGFVECTSKSKIIGGWHVGIKDVPYQVAIARWHYSRVIKAAFWVHACGGSIVNEWWILTAAHCITANDTLQGKPPESLAVAVGRDNSDFSKQWLEEMFLEVERVVPHPQFFINRTKILNDIGLLRLSESLVWSNKVQPVVLPSASYAPERYSQTCIAGSGRVSRFNRVKDKRLKAICSYTAYCAFNGPGINFTNVSPPYPEVCWTPRATRSHSHACNGDSGNGLVKKLANRSFLIVGITSAVSVKCYNLSLFTHVSYHVSWITSIIEEVPSQKQSG